MVIDGVMAYAYWRTHRRTGDDEREFVPWDHGPVPAEHQLRGIHAIRLWERELEPTESLLTEVMGFTADESLDDLGTSLVLPPWMEKQRDAIEAALPSLETPRP